MSFLKSLFPRGMPTMLQPARVVTGIKAYSETPGVLWARNESSAGVPVDEFEALSLSSVFAACMRLASLQSMLPIGVYEKLDKGREERPFNTVSNLLNVAMNDEQTAFVGRFFMEFWKPLFGSSCAEIGWDGAGRAAKIWPLGPWRVEPKYDDDDRLYYLVDGKRRVAADDMLYVPHVTEDGVRGQGFVHYAIESIGTALAADESAARFYANDMKPGGMLRHPGNPSDKARKTFREEWAQNHGGVHNRNKVGVLWGGWEWLKEAGMVDPDKAQLLESRKYSTLEVARWMNVPPHWLAELGRATWGNVEQQGIEVLVQVVLPLLIAKEQEYGRKMLAPPRLYCKHNVNALLRGDMAARGDFYAKMTQIAAFSVNDILDLEDMNQIGPEGDRRFIAVNMQPLDDIMTGAKAQLDLQKAKQAAKPAKPPAPPVAPATDVPPKPAVKPAIKKAAAASVAGMMEHLLTMLGRKECNEANRASKKPNAMMAWMNGFYDEAEVRMDEALRPLAAFFEEPIVQAGLDPSGQFISWANLGKVWAKSWCDDSRSQLLSAMDGPPEEWPNRMIDLLGSWQTRPTDCALLWTKPLLEKEMNDAAN